MTSANYVPSTGVSVIPSPTAMCKAETPGRSFSGVGTIPEMHGHFISFKDDQQERSQTVWVLLTLTLPRAFSSGQPGGPALLEGRRGLHLSSSLGQAGGAEGSLERRRRAWRGGQVVRPGTFLCGLLAQAHRKVCALGRAGNRAQAEQLSKACPSPA